MARRKKKRGSRKKPRPSVMGWAGVGALVLPGLKIAMGPGTMEAKLATLQSIYTGHDGQRYRFDLLGKTYGPALVLWGMKLVAGKAGIRAPKGSPVNL